ncbi:undecaprenyl-phosphate alpha-N-acetylglucosaminyl 1-phosphate transferase [Thiocapsa roseopersicina]|uniref:UDP-GlcNAc:undecaprenyl-phosphate GlcNAc-1-phosphate transferase n=1 Tax=Thiocapsa roseopersicina TaxID=1058 RepID=A0A1H2Q978_THIRO|nr:undecaprenyl-phosphate alpha-N-acetylglucosaminyl 1-phosphate transferase [Thiocapsa roseopersicina]SDW03706.1 UDP-GlcNAc:undecaprenyl-phosphate GlcNAc-1-phosphate transferase [Thiocapsa roseopersicina]
MTFSDMVIAFVVSSVVLAVLYPLAPRIGLMDHPGDRRKVHRHAVPPIGGIAIFSGLVACSLLSLPFAVPHLYGMAGAALLVLVGALDDRFGLGPRVRLVAQVVAALLLTLGCGVTLTALGDLLGFGPIELGVFSVPFTVFAMVGVINAINMIDGIDGLAGGLILIAFGTLLLLAPEIGPIQILLLATIAVLMPYLICNLELFGVTGRKVFLGDAGSLLLGYILVWALVDAAGPAGSIDPVTALWIIAIPLMDTLRVMGRRILQGVSPFTADAGHLHHFLSRVFHSTRKALILMLAAAILLTGVGVFGFLNQIGEAVMFYAALSIFAAYLLVARYVHSLSRALEQGNRQIVGEVT